MTKPFDIDSYLARTKQIAVIWSIEDVQEIRPDLDADQAWEVLKLVDSDCSAECGITWDTLQDAAADLYGPEPDTVD